MEQLSFDEKKRLHDLEIQKNVDIAKDSSNYCTYLTEVSQFDPEVTVYSARRIGRGHIKGGKPCQDYCLSRALRKGHVFAVSDGVSACLRSEKGSQFACEAAIAAAQQVDEATKDERSFVEQLCNRTFRKALINIWLELVKKDIVETDEKAQPGIRDIELYGATLSLAIMTEHRIITLNLGDGQILLFNPVDAMRVRWHLPKEDSVTAALCNPDSYEDSFIVHNHDRQAYSGILLSTDGIYDTLSNYSSFYAYARQITQRFESCGEPMQPFCFLENLKEGTRMIDLSANISQDDCSIILVADHHPISSATADQFARLSKEYCVTEVQTRADKLTLYSAVKDKKRYAVLALEGNPEQLQSARAQAQALELTTAKLLQPVCELKEEDFAFAVYPDIPYFSPIGFFSTGKLKERAEVKYGINASGLALKAYRTLLRCEKELRQKGFCLNDNARFLSFFTKEGLALMPEAISPVAKASETILLWQLFDNLVGTLTCGNLVRPVFSFGFNSAGPNLLSPLTTPPENLCYVKRDLEGTYLLMNSGKTLWKLPDGTAVNPGCPVELKDGLSFEIVQTGAAAGTIVTYKKREEIE